jgi:ATP-binding cassette subfamily B protein
LTRVFYLLRQDGPRILLALFLLLVKHSPVWFLPIITANIINVVTYPALHSSGEIWRNLVLAVLLTLQNIPMHTLYVRTLSMAIRQIEARIRTALISRMHQLSMGFHEEFRSGKLQTKMLRDVESIEGLINQSFNNILVATTNIVFALVVTVMKHPLIAVFYLLMVPVAAVLLRVFRSRMRKTTAEYRQELETMSSNVSEMIEMIPVTRAHGAEEAEIKRIRTQVDQIRIRAVAFDTINAIFGSSTFATFNLFQFIVMAVCAWLAWEHKILVGDVVLYSSFFGMISGGVNSIINIYPQLNKGIDSLNSIGEILECPDIEKNEGKSSVPKVTGRYTFEKVNFSYPSAKVPALRDFSLEVKPGQITAFVGESGAGKSTVINLIIGFRRPVSGKVLLDGADMETLDLRQYRRHLAVVPQQTVLFAGTVRDNITYGLDKVPDPKIWEALETANAAEFVRKMPAGLDTLLGEHGNKISGGQKQRLSIARAVVRDPKVIIFDEATSSVDPASESLIHEAVSRAATGRTMFIVSHRFTTVENADLIVVMKKGEIVETGTYAELSHRKGEFHRLKHALSH